MPLFELESSFSLMYPLLAQVLLVVAVWLYMYVIRINAIRRDQIPVEALALEAQAKPLLQKVAGPSENFSNLFELPVLFYLLAIVLMISERTDGVYLVGAWLFVLSRYAHSFVHCTYNRVMHRFLLYMVGALVLWFMWFRFAWHYLASSV